MPKHYSPFSSAWLLLCALCFNVPAIAGTNESVSPFIVDSWSTSEGLPQSSVISVIQTRNGYLWLGTLNGLVRFDGIHFTVFDENNTPGLDNDRIVFLFEDSRTNLWLGTESSGLAMIQNGKIKNFEAETANAGAVTYAWEDSGGIWFYSDKGTCNYHDGKMNFYQGVFSQQLFFLAKRLIIPRKSGGFWQLSNGRVQKWNSNRLEKDFGASPWGSSIVTSACEDQNGNLIVGTLGAGVFWYDADGNYQQISTEQGLSHPGVLSLCMDSGGNLWAGTDGGGLNRIKRKIFNAPKNSHSWVVQSVSADNHGGLWMAFNGSGVSYWITNSARDFGVGHASNAWTTLVDQKQQVWAGTRDEGLFQLQTNHFQHASGAEMLGPQIFALFEDSSGQLWVGAQNGLGCWNGSQWKIFTTRDGLSENIVRAIAQDTNGNFWIGTENRGLIFFANGKFISYQATQNGLPGNDISCLDADKDGVLWVGTSGHGLARFQNGKWTRYSTDDGLASDSIDYIIEDDADNLWVGSNAGLMRISKKSLNDFANGTMNFISCRTYVETDGLPTRECSSGSQPAACRTSDGKMWFSTTKGLASVNPADLKTNLQSPTVMIESVLINSAKKTNRLDSAPQTMVIPPGHSQLEIDYTALNFSAPNEVHFKYRLEGRETAWTPGDARVAHYNELLPGQYRFHVIACNEDGLWNETGDALEVTVQPQFWQTWWFEIVAILCLGGIVIAIVRFISTQKLRRQLQLLKQQEALEKERSRIARDLHDQLGANLTQVALLGEMAEADKNSPDEIESHAKQISETARETTHSLDEIVWAINPSNDTLEGLANYACKYAQEYLALAGLRYRVDVPAQLPPTPIPPEVRHNVFLAFKEAVNNVVKHAQASEVWIRLRLQPQEFILEIEDNGRGIANADWSKGRSGLRNMKKRMDDIGGNFEIRAAQEKGTIVRLTVPIIFNHG